MAMDRSSCRHAAEVNSTTSYARVMDNKEVQKKVDAVAEPVQRNYESVIRQLRDKNAVGSWSP